MTTVEDFNRWLQDKEDTSLEFKEGKNGFDEKELMEYCAAIANGSGGKFVLGVSNIRKVVSTNAFTGTLEKLQHEVLQQLRIHVEIEELMHPSGRVLIFHISSHLPRTPVKVKGQYWMRVGPIKKEMDPETLRKISNEHDDDFSSHIVSNMTIEDLDEKAVSIYKKHRAKKTGNFALIDMPIRQVLADTSLLTDKGITTACLILLGKEEKIRNILPQSEIIYEWRSQPGQTHHDFRKPWKGPYFAIYDEVWDAINSRNIRVPYQEGFVQREVWAFDEKACREAVNNAVAHRDYTKKSGSIFIEASPASFVVTSPGGFLPGISPENVLQKKEWRNRLIMEALSYTDLVERSGQGIDYIFEATIRDGKGMPTFDGTDGYSVQVNIPASVLDTNFVRFVEKAINEKQVSLSVQEWIELESVRVSGKISFTHHRKKFLELGLIEQVDKTKGARYILSQRYYEHIGRKGIHTREAGLSRDAKKQLILEHLQRHGQVQRQELRDAFPTVPLRKLSGILQDLKDSNRIEHIGSRKTGYWIRKKSEINKSEITNNSSNNGFIKPK